MDKSPGSSLSLAEQRQRELDNPPEPPLISLGRAGELAGRGKSWAYDHKDELPGVVVIGGRYLVRSKIFLRWLLGDGGPTDSDGAPTSGHPAPFRLTG